MSGPREPADPTDRPDAPVAEPGSAEPAAVEAGVVEAGGPEPAAVEPAAVEPAAVEPAAVEPAAVEPAAVEPAAVEPAAVEAGGPEPGAVEAGVVPDGAVPAIVEEPERRGRWPDAGPVADEAARLAEAAGDWARRAVPELAAVLRGDRPEVTGKLVEAGAAVAAAARAVLDTLVRPPAGRPGPDAGPGDQPPTAPGPRVEPIDVE